MGRPMMFMLFHKVNSLTLRADYGSQYVCQYLFSSDDSNRVASSLKAPDSEPEGELSPVLHYHVSWTHRLLKNVVKFLRRAVVRISWILYIWSLYVLRDCTLSLYVLGDCTLSLNVLNDLAFLPGLSTNHIQLAKSWMVGRLLSSCLISDIFVLNFMIIFFCMPCHAIVGQKNFVGTVAIAWGLNPIQRPHELQRKQGDHQQLALYKQQDLKGRVLFSCSVHRNKRWCRHAQT